MIGVDRLIEKLNSLISGGSLTELEVTQLSKVIDTLEKKGVSSVLSTSYLPNVVENKGRLFWLQTEQRYVYSNGVGWDTQNIFKIYKNLYSWGFNAQHQLGDGTKTSRISPSLVWTNYADWVFVTVGSSHTIALRANGTAWAWGYNVNGRLGISSLTRMEASPVLVSGGFTDWISASAGHFHSLGLRANGTAWAWGYNSWGNLGDGTTSSRSSPVSVVGGFTDWVSVSGGIDSNHSCGIRANGTAWGWGINFNGQIGDGTTTGKSSPVSVVGGFTDWVFIKAGGNATSAIRANGTAWGWGTNSSGELGDGTTTGRSSPVSVVGGFTDWVSIAAGYRHRIAVRANGTLWGWGNGASGVLGDNTTSNRSSPVSVVGGFTDWIFASAGRGHSAGIRSNGTLWAWGGNGAGQLGDNTITSRSSPVSVVGGFTDWIFAGNGNTFTVGIRAV